ncbi:plant intracellular Ras-group-related LRR protein 6-like [Rhodamnia argentea]|uniref:Plant intracellular Ras-group-related LRR protein 6-like n=1 Tax=Rhodamnia argentea TaxID=178133 RepID=A0A8B8QCY5_9MYRT|nr:plant intracellular Ras-group-related LRR protein 6-like [Rhodamnia argentea]
MMYERRQPPRIVTTDHEQKAAEKRKRAVDEGRLEIVDLSGLSLDSLPSPPLDLGIICKLDLSNNNLQMIPEPLAARLLNVAVLDVQSNQLKALPNSIGCLSKLKLLNVAGNLLVSLPTTILKCRSLEELNANFNQLTMLPDAVGLELGNLKKLSVNSNKLAHLPHSTSRLTSLCVLDARLNCLRSLPDDLENLVNLQTLNISQNFHHLQALPYSIGLLLSLVELDISYNRITALPDSMGCLRKLQKLCVEGNPLILPPAEVMEQGLHAVKEYLGERMNAGYESPPKKKSWIGKLVRYGTFNGNNNRWDGEDRERFTVPDFQSINGLATPRHAGMFSPRRLFSLRNYFSR